MLVILAIPHLSPGSLEGCGLDMFPVLFHHFGCHALHGGIRVASGPDILHDGGIVFAVITGRLGEGHAVRRIIGQTEAVIVDCTALSFLNVLPSPSGPPQYL